MAEAAAVRATAPPMPAIAGEFATTPGTVGLTVIAFTLAYGVCQLLWGPVGDRWGKYHSNVVWILPDYLAGLTVGQVRALVAQANGEQGRRRK